MTQEEVQSRLRTSGDGSGEARRVTLLGLVINVFLAAGKFLAGVFGTSSAMIADATHSLSDLLTDVVVYFGLRAAEKPADSCHPYGHGKIEALLAAVCGASLLMAAGGLFFAGATKIWAVLSGGMELSAPGISALIAAGVSVTVKEWLYRYTVAAGRRVGSSALVAKAWDHRSDAISSLAALAGIGGAFFGGEKLRVLDPLVALAVSVFIVISALPVLKSSLDELIDRALPDELEEELESAILSTTGVVSLHKLKTRRVGRSIAVDVHIQMDGRMSLNEAHEISRRVEEAVWQQFGRDSYVSLHMEPVRAGR